MELQPIGIIRTPHRSLQGMPIQPVGARGFRGVVEVDECYEEGLEDLDGFSHVVLIYHLHRARGYELKVVPFMDSIPRGLFATRAPRRPNPIGLSVVRLVRVEGRCLHVEDVDILDGTPLLDIKPYVPDFDDRADVRTGWLENVRATARTARSDDRFSGADE